MSSAAGDLPAPRSRARRIGGLAAGLLVVAFLAASVIAGWSKVTGHDWQLDVPLLLLGVVAAFLSLLANAFTYVLVLERLSAKRLPRLRLMAIWARSLLARYVPGNVMMVAGRLVLGREAGVPGRVTLAASVYEQALLLGIGAIASVGLLLGIGDLRDHPWLWVVALVPLGLALLHPRVFAPLSTWALRKVGREPLEVFLSAKQVCAVAGLYVIGDALLITGVWGTVRGLSGPGTGNLLVVGGAFLLSFVVSMLAFVFPSGLGVREGVFALVLARSLPGGVAIALAAAARLVLTLVEIAFAGAMVGLERRSRVRDEGPQPAGVDDPGEVGGAVGPAPVDVEDAEPGRGQERVDRL